MAAYSGLRTEHALRNAQEAYLDRDIAALVAETLTATQLFADVGKRAPNFAFLANLCEAASHRSCRGITDIAGIDWSLWRLATEYRLLHHRIKGAQTVMSPTTAANQLHLGIALSLTGRAGLARPILADLAARIAPVLDRMTAHGNRARDWGAIRTVFQDVLPQEDLPPSLRGPGPSDLAAARAARPTYSDGRAPSGALLSHIGADLVPVELIYLARKLDHPDPELAALDAHVAATGYPADESFQDMDIALSVAGF